MAHKALACYRGPVGDKIERECPACGATYHADATRLKLGRQTTCSRACSYKARTRKASDRQEFQCGHCGKQVLRHPGKRKPRHGLVFCSSACAYLKRQRVVDRPYEIRAVWDRSAAAKKGGETRRRNAKPYPQSAKREASARMSKRIQAGFAVSKLEHEAAEVMARLGIVARPGVLIRGARGRIFGVIDLVVRDLAIEVHGTYWHGGRWSWLAPDAAQARNLEREEAKVAAVRALGYRPRILWEHDFKRDPVGAVLAVVR
jgi:G:T-mismatch repair DNA endonuclease (very short patch repair protein)/endogenous inhibitor of DNA gyrase (YacG/DUF329 family)